MPPAYLLIAVTVMAVLYFHAPGSEIIPPPWNLLGAIPLLLGVILNVKADAAFSQYETTVKPHEAPKVLITSGVFRVSRHPIFIKTEERVLKEHSGEAWLAYKEKIRQWI